MRDDFSSMKLEYRGFQILPQIVEKRQVWLVTCRNYSRNFNRVIDAVNAIDRIKDVTSLKNWTDWATRQGT